MRAFLPALLLLAAAAPAQDNASPGAPSCRDCGFVLIGLDDVRADRVSGPRSMTPRLDAFFSSGAVFTEAVSQAPWTLPSFMSVMTAQHPSRHGVTNKYSDPSAEPPVPARLKDLNPASVTLAEVLRSRGWRTAAFTGGAGLTGLAGFSRGFEIYSDSTPFAGFADTVPQALAWLKTIRPGERFFLFVHGYDSHPFYSGPGRSSAEADRRFRLRRQRQLEGAPAGPKPGEKAAASAAYDAAVRRMDGRLGPLLDALGAPRLRGRVLVAAVSDHGEELFDHGGVDHGLTLDEELIRVPFNLRGPGIQARRVASQVRLVDILPTALDLLGISEPQAVCSQRDGVSLSPLLAGRPLSLDAFSETDFLLHASLRSLRTWDGWKLVHDQRTRRSRLYDLRRDPAEAMDLSQRENARLERLDERLLSAFDIEPASPAAQAACEGPWKLVREDGVSRLYDLRSDPLQKRDASAERPDLARRLDKRITPTSCGPGTSGRPGSQACR